jgi:hypothetical protein
VKSEPEIERISQFDCVPPIRCQFILESSFHLYIYPLDRPTRVETAAAEYGRENIIIIPRLDNVCLMEEEGE